MTEGRLDRWAEWLVRTRYENRSQAEIDDMLALLGQVRERVLDRARISAGDTVVDVGTGIGLLAIGALDRVGEEGDVLAVDISVDCLEELEREQPDPRFWYLIGSAEIVPLPDAFADAVLTRSVLIYVEDKGEAAREFARILVPGGRVSLFEPLNRQQTQLWEVVDFGGLADRVRADFYRRWPPEHPMHNFDGDDLQRMFAGAGFAEVDVEVHTRTLEVTAEAVLHGVGAPGAPSVVEAWSESFAPGEVHRLVAAVEGAGTMAVDASALLLAGTRR